MFVQGVAVTFTTSILNNIYIFRNIFFKLYTHKLEWITIFWYIICLDPPPPASMLTVSKFRLFSGAEKGERATREMPRHRGVAGICHIKFRNFHSYAFKHNGMAPQFDQNVLEWL